MAVVLAIKNSTARHTLRIRAQGHFKQLAKEAQRLGGFKTPSQAANAALAEYIDRARCQQYRA
jgi:hypothetical protein